LIGKETPASEVKHWALVPEPQEVELKASMVPLLPMRA